MCDDGVTPTPRGRKLFSDDTNFEAHTKSFEEESKYEQIIRGILETRNSNR